jgi:hypothetical protein
MTVFIADIASYQAGIRIAELRNAGYDAVIIKCTESGGYVNPYFAGWVKEALDSNFPVASYHFVHPGNYDAQAANIHRVDPPPIPIWMDTEAGATRDDAYAIADRLRNLGQTVAGVYFGAKPKAGYGGWWRADYWTNPAGSITSVYAHNGGDTSSYWVGQDIWQFGSRISIPGHSGLDASAYRGTLDGMLSHGWFHQTAVEAVTLFKGASMSIMFQDEHQTAYEYVLGHVGVVSDIALVRAYFDTNPGLNRVLPTVPKAVVDKLPTFADLVGSGTGSLSVSDVRGAVADALTHSSFTVS